MKDDKGVVIYVGKALSLKSRVSSYFQKSTDLGAKKGQMLNFVIDFEVLHCESEWEALLTENRLIKDIHPRFNARLTDDKTFPYLAITMREDFPGVYITREPGPRTVQGGEDSGPLHQQLRPPRERADPAEGLQVPDVQPGDPRGGPQAGPLPAVPALPHQAVHRAVRGEGEQRRPTAATSTAS